MDNRYPKNSHLFTIDEDMRSVSTNSPGLINISSDSGEEFLTEQPNSEPIYLRFRIGGPLNDPMTAFVNEDAARLFAVSEPESRDDSVIKITGTDFEREMLSMISEDTELPNISPISFFESSGSNSEELLLNANFANVPRNNFGKPVLAVPPVRAERPARQIHIRSDTDSNVPPAVVQGNGPIRPTPITPMVIPHEIPQPNYSRPYNGGGILLTPMVNQFGVPATQFQLPNLAAQNMRQPPYNPSTEILQPDGPVNIAYYHNANGQLYLDTQGTHSNMETTDVGPARSGNNAQQQRNPLRRQLNPLVMPHVQGNCHWCGMTYGEVVLDALAAYTATTEYPGETMRDRNIRSRAYLDGFEAALICFKNAGLS